MTKPTAFLYARFSTSRQQFSDSLRRQTEAAKEYCDRHGYELSEKTFEDLGVSGFKSARSKPALEEFIAAVEQGKIPRGSILLCEDHDRLSRLGWVHTMNLIHRLVGMGVKIVMTKSGKIYDANNVSDLGDNIVLMVGAERSWAESQRKSDLIRAQRSQVRRNRDVCGKLPFWIKRAENGSQFEFDPLKLNAVKRLVELRLQGKSMQGVAKILNSEGYVTGAGSAWSGSGVRSIVQNAALYGAKEYFDSDITTGRMNSKPIDVALNVFPKLIEFETWQAMQQKSSGGQGGRVTRKGAYSNLLKCGLCGGAMTQRTSKYKGDLRVYRVCLQGLSKGWN
ncbi:recombinase family protein [Vibrio sp. VNB-15]